MQNAKWTIAKVLGAIAVGGAAAYSIKKVAGAEVATSVVGGILVLLAHEAFDAPVASLIYEKR